MQTRLSFCQIPGTYAEQSCRHSERAVLRLRLKSSRE
jgi:hypothetical protein